MILFKRRPQHVAEGASEERFLVIFDLVKDLDRADFKNLLKGIESAYEGICLVRKVRTRDEKEVEDINKLEHEAEVRLKGEA